MSLFGIENIRLTRCGYTGEDGFELSVPSDHVTNLTEQLLSDGGKMAGLGARDTLRLEAGLCLYGNDIDQDTLPPSAVLLFTVPKKRRADNNFPGCSQIVKQQKDKPTMKRVGFIFEDGKAPPRAGATIMLDGDTIGSVTSGKIHNFFILKILLFFRGTIAKCRSKYWYGICSIRICQTRN